jgi:hypothetical protein
VSVSGPGQRLRGASHLDAHLEGGHMTDRRCRLGPAAKIEMIRRRERGESLRSIARSMACSPTTVKTAWDRWQDAAEEQREDFSCLLPRRPIPRTCPWSLSADAEQRILEARAKSNWGPMRLMALTGRHRGTIYKVSNATPSRVDAATAMRR